jgi:hypothetical protein
LAEGGGGIAEAVAVAAVVEHADAAAQQQQQEQQLQQQAAEEEHRSLSNHNMHRQRTGRSAAGWTDRTREAMVKATIGAAEVHAGKSYALR